MIDELDLKEKILIIKTSNLINTKILDNNYLNLIRNTSNVEENKKFVILRTTTQLRIKELTND